MANSKRRQNVPDQNITSPFGSGQGRSVGFPDFAARLQEAAHRKGLKSAPLAALLGATRGTFARYWNGERLPPADILLALSDTLGVTPQWLIRGSPARPALVTADEAEWVEVPEYDLRELTDQSRGPVVSSTPIRKDWLNRALNQSTGLWLARLPADLPRFDLREGDTVFVRDVEPGEAQDGAIYIVRIWGHLTVARIDSMLMASMNSIEANLQDRALAPRDVGTEDGKAILVARVLGAPLRRL